ncbi:MAG: hypothetical protein K2I01_06625, partial [Lachnospiraceae bacterium]|nr:hypothetical protein [Lachnospiraceae bacterium]
MSLSIGNYTQAGYASPLDTKPQLAGMPEEAKKGQPGNEGECQTCKNRKYQDGSDEMVSFKS